MPESIFNMVVRLTEEVNRLKTELRTLTKNTDYKPLSNYSKVGSLSDRAQINPIDVGLGIGKGIGGNIIWNDSELSRPPYNQKPDDPTIGFNKHSHSEFSGGALEANTLEIVEYKTNSNGEILNKRGNEVNRHCQQFWNYNDLYPEVAVTQVRTDSGNYVDVEKKGKLDLVFSPNTDGLGGKWGVSAFEIDVEKCYLVRKNPDGTIMRDENGNEMKSPLLHAISASAGESEESRINRENEELNKSGVVWDKSSSTFRFYATFAPQPEEPEES